MKRKLIAILVSLISIKSVANGDRYACIKMLNENKEGFFFFHGGAQAYHFFDGNIYRIEARKKVLDPNHGVVKPYCYEIRKDNRELLVWINCQYPPDAKGQCFQDHDKKDPCSLDIRADYSLVPRDEPEGFGGPIFKLMKMIEDEVKYSQELDIKRASKIGDVVKQLESTCDQVRYAPDVYKNVIRLKNEIEATLIKKFKIDFSSVKKDGELRNPPPK